MMRNPLSVSLLVASFLAAGSADADHFAIHLDVKSGKESKTVETKSPARPEARPALVVQAGKRIEVSWSVTATSKSADKDVLIHLFVVREAKPGQAEIPKLDKGVPAETAMTMDFQPNDKANGTLQFQIDTPGAYLLRLETRGADEGATLPEQFVALDLVVQ